MRLGRICRVERWGLEDILGNVGSWRSMKHFVLCSALLDFWGARLMELAHEAYPACMRIQEPPKDTVTQHLLHPPTPIQKHSQHALSQLDYAGIFLRFRGLGGIVGHGVLFGYGRNDECWVKVHQRDSERSKLGVSAPYLKALVS